MANTNITTLTEAQVAEYHALIEAKKAKAEKQAKYNERRRVWMKLMVDKAKAAGIVVTDAEVDAELA